MMADTRECVQLKENLWPHRQGGILMYFSIGTRSVVNNFIKHKKIKAGRRKKEGGFSPAAPEWISRRLSTPLRAWS